MSTDAQSSGAGARALIRLAVPSAVFTVLTNGYRLVDQYFIQDVSTEAQAAIGSSVFVMILFYAAFELIAAGAGPLIARCTGAGDEVERRAVFGAALVGSLLVAVFVIVVGFFGALFIARSLGLSGLVAEECVRYLRALALTSLPLVLTPLIDQVFISMGHARAPMVLHAISLGLNWVFTPVLIYWAGLGIVGAALASNGARAVATGIGLVMLVKIIRPTRADLRFGLQLSRVARIGLPMALGTATYSLVYWVMLQTSVSPLGHHVNAALGIGFSALEGVSWPIFHGISLAVASLVGRHLGAGRPDLARRTVKNALPITTVVGAAASLIFWLGGAALTDIFTDEPLVHAAATEYAVILAASQLFVAWESLTEGVLAGAGDTRTIFWWSAPLNALRIPLAWVAAFPLGMGAAGIWWMINVTTYAKVLGKGWAVLRGRWATLEI